MWIIMDLINWVKRFRDGVVIRWMHCWIMTRLLTKIIISRQWLVIRSRSMIIGIYTLSAKVSRIVKWPIWTVVILRHKRTVVIPVNWLCYLISDVSIMTIKASIFWKPISVPMLLLVLQKAIVGDIFLLSLLDGAFPKKILWKTRMAGCSHWNLEDLGGCSETRMPYRMNIILIYLRYI